MSVADDLMNSQQTAPAENQVYLQPR